RPPHFADRDGVAVAAPDGGDPMTPPEEREPVGEGGLRLVAAAEGDDLDAVEVGGEARIAREARGRIEIHQIEVPDIPCARVIRLDEWRRGRLSEPAEEVDDLSGCEAFRIDHAAAERAGREAKRKGVEVTDR